MTIQKIKISLKDDTLAHRYDITTFNMNPYRIYADRLYLDYDDYNKTLVIGNPPTEGETVIEKEGLYIPPDVESVNLHLLTRHSPITGEPSFRKVTRLAYNDLRASFTDCKNLTGVADFDSLTEIAPNGMEYAFQDCINLTGINFRNLVNIQKSGMLKAFNGCYSIKSITFPELDFIGQSGLFATFEDCDSLTKVSFPKLRTVGYSGMLNTFANCENLGLEIVYDKFGNPVYESWGKYKYTHSVTFESLEEIYRGETPDSSFGLWHTFENCPNVWEVHFPVELEKEYKDWLTPEVLFGEDSEDKKVLFDYVYVPNDEPNPITVEMDFGEVDSLGNYGFYREFAYAEKFVNGVDLSKLKTIGAYGLYQAFYFSTAMPNEIFFESIDPSTFQLEGVDAKTNPFYQCFYGCKSITSVHFPAKIKDSYENCLTEEVLFGDTFENSEDKPFIVFDLPFQKS